MLSYAYVLSVKTRKIDDLDMNSSNFDKLCNYEHRFMQHPYMYNPYVLCVCFLANSAVSDQTPQNMASDQAMQCLFTRILIQNEI